MRNRFIPGLVLCFAVLLASRGTVFAQGTTNAALRGRVTSGAQGLPGVQVELTSPALQGTRTTYTKANGDYVFVGMPPGDYTVNFKLQGLETVTKTKVALTAAAEQTLDVSMVVAGVTAATTVTAKTETVSTGLQGSTTITTEITNKLPVARTIVSAVAASSGVAQVTGLGNAFTISGGPTFDNLFTVDGAVIIDNVRATPNNLFIEDAIQETTTTVNSVSAEYGRFTGGVVNTITKSGGNLFSGSFRTTLTNDAWSAVSPAKEKRVQKVSPRYEATIGGPIWQDHIWFFGSGRYQDTSVANQTLAPSGVTPISFQQPETEKRYQGKLTFTPLANQTFSGNYLKIDDKQVNNFFGNILDTDSLVTRELPQRFITANYNGVITNNFFVEGLYSQRKFSFIGSGSQFTDLIKGTLMRDRAFIVGGASTRYNSPTFCGVCDPENRDNEDFQFKGTYFLSTPSLGSHTIQAGYDHFAGSRFANNYQSGSNYRLFTTNAIFQGGDIFPVIGPSSYVYYTPIFTLSQSTSALTHSAFVNDSWRLNRLSVNLGVRYDKNAAHNSLGVVTANDSAFSPRLAAAYDLTGSGSVKLGASYAHYVGAIQDTILDGSSAGGQPGVFLWYVTGAGAPVINNPPGATLTTRAQALQQIFDWFFAQGCPDLSKCKLPLAYAQYPGLSNKITTTLKSPYAREYTFGINGTVGGSGAYRMDFVRREFKDFYNTVLNTSTGQASDPTGNKYDVGIIGNTNDFTRNYTALQTQFQYRLFNNRLNLGGAWTWSHTLGNFNGEAGNTGPQAGPGGASPEVYPEYKVLAWNLPSGDLATDQRHRVRVFAIYDMPFIPEKFGVVSFSVNQAYDTGAPYGAVGTVRSRTFVTNPGYIRPPSSVTYYFTPRDAFRTDDIKRTDIAINFSTKVANAVEIFIQPQVLNLFNNRGVIAVDTTVNTVLNPGGGTYTAFNPFTTTPVQRPHLDSTVKTANWDFGPNFGKATSVNSYQIPRQFQVTMGLRF